MEKIIIENAKELISMVDSKASEEHKQKIRKLKIFFASDVLDVLREKGISINNQDFWNYIDSLEEKGIIKRHWGYPNIFDDKYKLI
tara:strand:+ start:223 stop:480 length:258 start_codon:yes stop_codon:yes gene_type:complete